MIKATIDQKELKKLLKNLKGLTPKMQKGILNLAVKNGAKSIQSSAKDNVPVDSGDLKDNIIIRKKTKGQKRRDEYRFDANDTVYTVGIAINKKAWYSAMIEFGTKYQAAQPYMVPAFEQDGGKVLEETKRYIKQRLEKAIKKGLIR